ncbi:PIN domain-containing protein [Nocardia alni]|uniref:PIN domain-containing protein n=1 Tax=Nocardia alni TaxID=2815723 RepID=UPI001C24DD1A|nr:PIN domain-containing protein [Nocardia alni]
MIVVVDASVLVAELLRKRGRELLRRPALEFFLAEEQWSETRHELERRIRAIAERGRLSSAETSQLRTVANEVMMTGVVEVEPLRVYAPLETSARRRKPRDPQDWPVMALDGGILTGELRLFRVRVADMDGRDVAC